MVDEEEMDTMAENPILAQEIDKIAFLRNGCNHFEQDKNFS